MDSSGDHPDYTDLSNGVFFSYSITTLNDETTTWATRMDHYFTIGKFDVHMRQILISAGIMLVSTVFALAYVKRSVKNDFKLLQSAQSLSSTSMSSHSTSIDSESDNRVMTGGLEIVSDASEQVGWY